ncbi:MAG TPA: hypothetical protein VES97_09045 [Solirubrobacteraceae bacterium]|nr:hypothetical protein [Solirubrobacteraceae bacterium]
MGGPGRSRAIGRTAALLLLSGAAIAAGGCGRGQAPSPAASRLEREDLIAASRALKSAEGSVATEVAATKAAWRLIANGLPADATTVARAPIQAAAGNAAKLEVPGLFQEAQAVSLTGPAAGLAGLFRSYSRLATRGWQLIGASIDAIEHGSAVAARFARANVALYIESVYDAHFSLAQIGRKLVEGYRKLGGADAFGAALTQAEVDGLAWAYSEASDRLHPHVGVRLGS